MLAVYGGEAIPGWLGFRILRPPSWVLVVEYPGTRYDGLSSGILSVVGRFD